MEATIDNKASKQECTLSSGEDWSSLIDRANKDTAIKPGAYKYQAKSTWEADTSFLLSFLATGELAVAELSNCRHFYIAGYTLLEMACLQSVPSDTCFHPGYFAIHFLPRQSYRGQPTTR